jgi:urea carboxylase system permease
LEEQTHQADVRDLARFGYKQELRRALGVYSSFAVAFSYISPSTGIFTLFILGISLAGGFFYWSWPIVVIGQLIIAFNFAEVSSHFPVAGSVYQWTKYLAGRTYAWFSGWIYLFAGVLTVSAVVATVPLVLIPLINNTFGTNIGTDNDTNRNVAILVLISTTLLSIFGVRIVAIVNNTGVVFEILGMVVFALILVVVYHHQSLSAFTDTSFLGTSNQTGTFLAAMFMSLFVIYGFDTASTLAEETKNPRREAPRAVIAAVIGAAVIGAIFLFAVIIAIPGDLGKFVSDAGTGKLAGGPLVYIITTNFPGWAANLYLLVVFAAIYVCCLAIQTSTIRLAFGMARDAKLPLSRALSQVNTSLHTPVWACIAVGVLALLPLLYYAGAGIIAIGATGMIYLSYILGNLAILGARLKGWPKEDSPFRLGRWGVPINIAGLVWGVAMEINFLWPRDASVGGQNPPLSTLPNISIPGFLQNVPIYEFTLGIILLVGIIYWAIAQRRSTSAATIAPAEAPA